MVIISSRTDKERISLDDYAGLGWEQPVVGAVFSVFLLSLAGFPLTAGFVGKLYILRAALSAGPEGLTLAIALVIASLISYFYYLRVVVVMYMRPAPAEVSSPAALVGAGAARTTVIVAAIAVLVLFLYPRPVMRWAEQSVAGVISAPARPMAGR
jgi:NADH-quinone oxidoreductase subunit N